VTDTLGSDEGREPRDYRLLTRIPTSLHTAIKRAAAEDKRAASDWIVVTLEVVLAERTASKNKSKIRNPTSRRRHRSHGGDGVPRRSQAGDLASGTIDYVSC
jgi:hypothetical protein